MRTSILVLTAVLFAGCGSDGSEAMAEPEDAPDGAAAAAGAGGSQATGGAKTGSGGSHATGGKPGSGGSQATGGGTPGSGGSPSAPDGGSGGTSPGTGGGPPHVVGACDGLGAVDQWEAITPPGVDLSDNGVVEVLVDPVHSGTVYTSGDKRGIYKSTDCGASFTKVNTGRNGSVLDTGTQWSMAIDRNEPNVLYAGNLYGSNLGLFKSTNSGVDWDPLFPAGSEVANTVDQTFVQEISMDPMDPKHLAVSFHNNCKGAYAPMCLAESKDAGATWRLFKGPANGWVENARPLVLGPTTLLYATSLDGLFYTGNGGATWEKVAAGGGHQVYRAKDGNYYIGTAYGLIRSSDGHAWSKIDPSPNGDPMMGDGKRMFTSWPTCCGNTQPYSTASESDGTKWSTLATPAGLSRGHTGYFAYDGDHHVLYAAATKDGLWRMVTQ